MKLSTNFLDKTSYVYLSLPLCIFLIGWLNPILAIIAISAIFIILRKIFSKLPDRKMELSSYILIVVSLVSVAWCILGGIGGFYYQSTDWHMRNALLHDLINYSFPVYYDNDSSLVYYMGFFLPAALVGKLALLFNTNENTAFFVGNIASLVYSVIGIFIISMQLFRITNANKIKALVVFLIFIFFSGIDYLYPYLYGIEHLHIEWHYGLQYSSNTTLLSWVYNQTIAPWLITILFFTKPFDIKKYGLFAVCSLFYSPFVFIGISAFLIFTGIYKLFKSIKKNKFYPFIKSVFCIENVLSVFLLLPFIYFYFKSNSVVSNQGFSLVHIKFILFYFLVMEFGLYTFFIHRNYKNNLIFKIMLASLCIIPFFSYSGTGDFCMRASIPALFILMIFIMKFLFSTENKIKKAIVIMLLLLGAITPYYEFYRGYHHVFVNSSEPLIKDGIKTLNNNIKTENCKFRLLTFNDEMPNRGNYCNYGTIEPDKTFFFKYLAKPNKKG